MMRIDEYVEDFLKWFMYTDRVWEWDTFNHDMFVHWYESNVSGIQYEEQLTRDRVYSPVSFGKRVRKAVRKQAYAGWLGWLSPYARVVTRIVSTRKSTGETRRSYAVLIKPDFDLHPDAWRRARDDSL